MLIFRHGVPDAMPSILISMLQTGCAGMYCAMTTDSYLQLINKSPCFDLGHIDRRNYVNVLLPAIDSYQFIETYTEIIIISCL